MIALIIEMPGKLSNIYALETTTLSLSEVVEKNQCTLGEDGKSIHTSESDPYLVFTWEDVKYISRIYLKVTHEPEEDWILQTFYAGENENFSEKASIKTKITRNGMIEVAIDQNVKKLRLDFGNKSAQTFVVDSLQINPDSRNLAGVLLESLSWYKIGFYTLVMTVVFCFLSGERTQKIPVAAAGLFAGVIFAMMLCMGNINRKTDSPDFWSESGEPDLKNFSYAYGSWLDKNIGYRRQLIDLKGMLMYYGLHTSPVKAAYVGEDGWIFCTDHDNVQIAEGTYPMSQEDYQETAVLAEKINGYLAERGTEMLWIAPSSKAAIYPEKVNRALSVGTSPSDYLQAAMEADTTIPMISVKEELLAAKEQEQIFHKTDTHWNDAGLLIAYQKIYDFLKENQVITIDFPELMRSEGSKNTDLGDLMGSEAVVADESAPSIKILNPKAHLVKSGDRYQALQNIQKERVKTYIYSRIDLYQNDSIDGKTAIVIGDSFFGNPATDTKMIELLAEGFSEMVYVWDLEILPEVLDLIQPDVLIYEKGERSIEDITESFKKSIIKNHWE